MTLGVTASLWLLSSVASADSTVPDEQSAGPIPALSAKQAFGSPPASSMTPVSQADGFRMSSQAPIPDPEPLHAEETPEGVEIAETEGLADVGALSASVGAGSSSGSRETPHLTAAPVVAASDAEVAGPLQKAWNFIADARYKLRAADLCQLGGVGGGVGGPALLLFAVLGVMVAVRPSGPWLSSRLADEDVPQLLCARCLSPPG